MNRLHPLPFKKVREILVTSGFAIKSSRGSHFKYENKKAGRTVIVPHHKGKDIPVGTIKSIIEMSGISAERFTGEKTK